MKKFFTALVLMALLVSVAVFPVWAVGGKNQNEIGAPEAPGPGDDSQGNQAG